MGSTKAKWRANQLAFYDGSTYETTLPLAPFYWIDDFVTDAQIKAAGVPGWTVVDTSLAGDTTPIQVADISCGAFQVMLDTDDEEEESGLHMNDQREINLDNGPIIEFRIKASTLATALAELYFGVAGDYVKGTVVAADQGPLIHSFFVMDGSGIVTIHTDDTENETAAGGIATGITVLATAYHVYRIDFTNVADVKFYIDGAGVATTTTFNMSQGTAVKVQPYIMCYKSAGAGVGTLEIDYVRIWQATR